MGLLNNCTIDYLKECKRVICKLLYENKYDEMTKTIEELINKEIKIKEVMSILYEDVYNDYLK